MAAAEPWPPFVAHSIKQSQHGSFPSRGAAHSTSKVPPTSLAEGHGQRQQHLARERRHSPPSSGQRLLSSRWRTPREQAGQLPPKLDHPQGEARGSGPLGATIKAQRTGEQGLRDPASMPSLLPIRRRQIKQDPGDCADQQPAEPRWPPARLQDAHRAKCAKERLRGSRTSTCTGALRKPLAFLAEAMPPPPARVCLLSAKGHLLGLSRLHTCP